MDALIALAPILALAGGAALILVIDMLLHGEDADLAVFFVAVGAVLLSIFACAGFLTAEPFEALSRNLRVDGFGGFLGMIVGLCALLSVCSSYHLVKRFRLDFADYLALLLLSTAGMQLLVFANELVTLFVGIELMSIPIYVLVGIIRSSRRATEASFKYLLLGGFASAFLLFGLALLYAVASQSMGRGTTVLTDMRLVGLADPGDAPLTLLALGLIVIGFAFKVGAVPFHQWVPDVYEGAPTPLTGFMATGVKAAAFGAFVRLLVVAFGSPAVSAVAQDLLWVLCLASMIVGNGLALVQTNIKRMLAYSSIGHAGYLLLGVLALMAGHDTHGAEVLFYLLAYSLTSLGAFAVIALAIGAGSKPITTDGGESPENETIAFLAGLGARRPFAAFALTVAMLSLAGTPFTGGFVGKLFVFWTAIETGFVGIAIVGILTSIVAVYYYLRVVWTIYMVPPEREFAPQPTHWALTFGLWVAVVGTLVLGLVPGPFLRLSRAAVAQLSTS